jgi:hypothetical protein
MLEAHCPTALEIRSPQGTVRARRTTRDVRRIEHDRFAAVPPHLSLLRDALAEDAARGRQKPGAGRYVTGFVPSRRRGPARTASLARQLTLAQWMSRTTGIR